MPSAAPTKKRKRTSIPSSHPKKPSATSTVLIAPSKADDILSLEESILSSPKHYNSILTLLDHLRTSSDPELSTTAAISLCRTFCRLMALGRLSRRRAKTDEEVTVATWLKERYNEYFAELCTAIEGSDSVAVTLAMRVLKEEAIHLAPEGEEACFWPHEAFGKVVRSVVESDGLAEEWSAKYLAFDDLRYSFYVAVGHLAAGGKLSQQAVSTTVDVLLGLENLPTPATEDFDHFYAANPPSPLPRKLPPILQPSAHLRTFQEAWLSLLRLPLPTETSKTVLDALTHRIVPSLTKPHLLMDFLVDSYDAGGSISLLAINGLFLLISTKNLDYPNFYPKLYALLNRDLFHVRYRSRFFRMLETFLDSTHLPAAMVASFIKRMSRLALSAPPAAVVTVVPFVYNLLQKHRACTYMMHRVGSPEEREEWSKNGYPGDPFDENEADPMKTGAIDSCVWELQTLMSHWHPNVATLARIIGEQFTKERYQIEDFLDHSYGSMLDAEVKKAVKRAPVVEETVPKRIFSDGGDVLRELWAFE